MAVKMVGGGWLCWWWWVGGDTCVVTTIPSTVTAPSSIKRSASRRLHSPLLASSLDTRSMASSVAEKRRWHGPSHEPAAWGGGVPPPVLSADRSREAIPKAQKKTTETLNGCIRYNFIGNFSERVISRSPSSPPSPPLPPLPTATTAAAEGLRDPPPWRAEQQPGCTAVHVSLGASPKYCRQKRPSPGAGRASTCKEERGAAVAEQSRGSKICPSRTASPTATC